MRFATSSFDAGVSGGRGRGTQQRGRRKDDGGGSGCAAGGNGADGKAGEAGGNQLLLKD